MSDNLTVACKYVMRSNVTEWACVSFIQCVRSILLVYMPTRRHCGTRDSLVSVSDWSGAAPRQQQKRG